MTVYVVLQAYDGENKDSGVGWGVAHTSSDVPGAEAACYEYLDTLSPQAAAAGVALATVPLRSWEPAVYRGKVSWSRETIKGVGPSADDTLVLGGGPQPDGDAAPPAAAQGTLLEPETATTGAAATDDDDVPMAPPTQVLPPEADTLSGATGLFDDSLDGAPAANA